MSDKKDTLDLKDQSPSPLIPFQLRLRTLKSSRNSLAKIGRLYAKGEIDEKAFKNLTWFFGQYISYLKTQDIEDISDRLLAIEKVLSKPKEKKIC